ncbi:hypothetical protein ACGFYU_37575 [Streptomyces sp. NPDC048337]|uniref:hypothetical protein n=1 Tax=Streptomyces sp. NPDC048337 TaxID=3365535 RepID=UPI003712A19F
MNGLKLRDNRLVLPVVLVAAVVAALFWPVVHPDPLSGNMCWGALSKDTAARLRTDGGSGLNADETGPAPRADRELTEPICLVSPNEDSGVLLFGLGVRKMMPVELTRPDARPVGDGLTGSVSTQRSWVRLSEECGAELGGKGSAVLLELRIMSAVGPQDVVVVRAALLDTARNLARKYHCPEPAGTPR